MKQQDTLEQELLAREKSLLHRARLRLRDCLQVRWFNAIRASTESA